ncbi:hypothetical protein HYT05_03285 [Candidatus Kaiserbacteria bacterium]|nr:hypothetical protein [Candidatus Kaiserbacteria bacterium]
MAKYYAFLFLVVILTIGWIFTGLGDKFPYRETSTAPAIPHAYDDPEVAIQDIHITAYYFVAANKAVNARDTSWKEPLTRALESLVLFHELQFAGSSHITYSIHPTAITGNQPNTFYDTDDTGQGNPHALIAIADEIAATGLAPEVPEGTYPVTYIIYDGVGASGMRVDRSHAALLNRRFLTDPAYTDIRETLVAHEFYHTIGIPDGYVLSTGTSTAPDLMGLGRSVRPLKYNYLDRESLRHMGL